MKSSASHYYRSVAAPRLTYQPNDLSTYRPNDLTTYRPTDLIYHGAIQDEKRIQNILQQADVLVCPSWSEGMPTVILEAMASGCAVIASDVGAVSEQVDDTNGILIEPGNKQQLKAALEDMLSMNNDTLKAMKMASLARIKEKFLWEQVAKKTIEAIRQVSD